MSELPFYRQALEPGEDAQVLAAALAERFQAQRDLQPGSAAALVLPVARLVACMTALKQEPEWAFDVLLDITGIDYLSYPAWRAERFAVVYNLKSTRYRHRLRLKVMCEEGDERVPTICSLYRIADWLEREVYDQYGIVFTGHPNLKRLLNHQDFVGHPLRKDYPVQKRQHLQINDPLIEELITAVEERGYLVLDRDEMLAEAAATVATMPPRKEPIPPRRRPDRPAAPEAAAAERAPVSGEPVQGGGR